MCEGRVPAAMVTDYELSTLDMFGITTDGTYCKEEKS